MMGRLPERVVVLMGGDSAERTISLQSGQSVLAALRRLGVQAEALDVTGNPVPALLAGRWDAAFIALHGEGGEDGTIQGVLEWLGLPYTGSGVLASALAMDKLRSKLVWQGAGLPTPTYLRIDDPEAAHRAVETLGLPLIVKPAREGSSLGMSRVERADAIEMAWREARRYAGEVFAERCIEGHELTVAIVDGRPLPVIGIETPRAFYDYAAKYQAEDTRFTCPAPLPALLLERCQSLALEAFEALGCRGWGRVDLFCDAREDLWLIEVNTVPGMTDHSLVPMAARAAGMDFDELVARVLSTAWPPTGGER